MGVSVKWTMGLSVPPFYLNKPNPIFSAANKYNSSTDWQILNIRTVPEKEITASVLRGRISWMLKLAQVLTPNPSTYR